MGTCMTHSANITHRLMLQQQVLRNAQHGLLHSVWMPEPQALLPTRALELQEHRRLLDSVPSSVLLGI